MAVVKIVVETYAPPQRAGVRIVAVIVALRPQCVGKRLLLKAVVCSRYVPGNAHHAEHVEPAVAVIDVRLAVKVGVFRLVIVAAEPEAEAVALAFHRAYAHHRAHRRVVTRAWVVDYLNALDVL